MTTSAAPGLLAHGTPITIGAFNKVCKDHDVDAIVGLDFGGDVALPDPLNPEIGEGSRTSLSLHRGLYQSARCAHRLPWSDQPTVAISSVGVPIRDTCDTCCRVMGVDAAGVAPLYGRCFPTAGASDAMPVDVLRDE